MDARLAANFKGVNRRVAAHMLAEGESPDCVDCGPADDKAGELGPRKGRRRVSNSSVGRILGVGAFLMPGERFRLFAFDDGSVRPEVQDWPDPQTIPPLGGDAVRVTDLTVSQVGAGTTNGTAKALASALDLGDFARLSLDLSEYDDALATVEADGFTTGNITLQAEIDAVWTDVWRWTMGATGIVEAQLLILPATGSVTQVRLQATSDVSGDIQADFSARLLFQRQENAAEIAVS